MHYYFIFEEWIHGKVLERKALGEVNLKVDSLGVLDIFALTEHERLFTVQTDEREQDEFEASFDFLQDPEQLFTFFQENEELLRKGPFKDRELKEAVYGTVNEARTLMRELSKVDR